MTRSSRANRSPTLLHPLPIGVGASLLSAAFVSDFIYWQTLLYQWNNFSSWLLVGGLVFAGLAGGLFIVDLATRRISKIAWLQLLGLTIAAVLSVLNAFVHSRDAYTAVVPEGILLSALVTVFLILIGFRGWNLGERRPAKDPQS